MPTAGPRITISQRWDLVGVGFVDIGKDLESLLLLGFGYSAEIVERKKEKKRGEEIDKNSISRKCTYTG